MKLLFINYCLFIFTLGAYSIIRSNNAVCRTNINQRLSNKTVENKTILGLWVSENNDLKVEVFEINGVLYGKLIEFTCTHKEKKAMKDHKDEKNPDPKLRNRSWLNTIVLYGLKYSSTNKWDGGLIYDLTTGKTYTASVTLNNNMINVRGYWGIELIGKSLFFRKTI